MIGFRYILLLLCVLARPGLPIGSVEEPLAGARGSITARGVEDAVEEPGVGAWRRSGDPPHLASNSQFPYPEKLTYSVEWRLMSAGNAIVQLARDDRKGWDFNLNIESSGLASRLYRVTDSYKVATLEPFCLANSSLDAQERRKHSRSTSVVDSSRKKLAYEERDLVKDRSERKELAIPECTYDIVGALAILRTLNLEPGKVTTMPITDGKKFVQARIEAQARDRVTVAGRSYSTTRYEAFLFDNVLYKRRGRLLIWIGDGPEHLPVQFRLLFGFPIGTITVELQKQER
jgi:hypothetical protein